MAQQKSQKETVDYRMEGIGQSVEITIGFARDALKGGVFINGGAVVAILAMVGQVAKGAPALIGALTPVLMWFVAGVWTGAVATGLSYLAQYGFTQWGSEMVRNQRGPQDKSSWRSFGKTGHYLAIGMLVMSYLCFGAGAWSASSVLSGYNWATVACAADEPANAAK